MKGDFTRWSFSRERHYHGVLKQQGRVDLDADWNEQQAIAAHRVETEAKDVIGASGAPAGSAGFVIAAAGNGANLTISKGRAYVDGLLCENESDVLITQQPDLPNFKLPTAAGVYIAYLSVWLRHVVALDDGHIREDALGGPDTCTRARTVWQVNLLPAGGPGAAVTCTSVVPAWDQQVAPSSINLAARAEPDASASGPCTIPASAGYRRLENQLYRVEIHATGANPTFKWSRDNGSVTTAWQGQNGNELSVSSIGRDSVLGFAAGQWVELTDDSHEFNFSPGTLVQLLKAQGTTLTIDAGTATGSVNFADFPLNPKIRRWDSAGAVALSSGNWLALEDGVQVNFSGGTLTTGDYWLIPARTLRANVDWPLDGAGNPIPAPPLGIARHYCRLAIVNFNGAAWSIASPCLPTFPPLTQITASEDKGIHVTDVALAKPALKILNDGDLPFPQVFAAEDFSIVVTCDAPIDPVSAQPTTCFVTVDLPYPIPTTVLRNEAVELFFAYQTLILPGIVKIGQPNQIIWSLDLRHQTMPFLYEILKQMVQRHGTSRLLLRLTLKGNCIWGRDDASLYLDGQAFGVTRKDADGTTHIGLRLPSGDGKRGGDFELWFWFLLSVRLATLGFAPNPINIGQESSGTITWDGPAPDGGAVIDLTSAAFNSAGAPLRANIGTIPRSVTVAQGQTSAQFKVTQTSLPTGTNSAILRVTATYGDSTLTADLTINRPVTVTGLSFAPNSVLGGATGNSQMTVTLSGPAGAGGLTVQLGNNNPGVAGVPQSIQFDAGQTSKTVNVTTTALQINAAPVPVQVTASLGGASTQAVLTVTSTQLR